MNTQAAVPTYRAPQPILASYLTHELRAPVTAIRLGLEILREQADEKLDACDRRMLSVAVRNTERLQNLVNDILDYARMASGKLALIKKTCDARELAREAVQGLQSVAISKNVVLVCEEGFPLRKLSADSGRIIQVLTNLISNALKFTPAGGRVFVSVEEGAGIDAGRLLFGVCDSGCGIAPEHLESVFEAFEQSAVGRIKAEGTGLGLTISRAIISQHGGRIWAESSLGRGARFYFTLPIA